MTTMPQLRNQRRSLGNHKVHRRTLLLPNSKPLESIENYKNKSEQIKIRQRPLTCYENNIYNSLQPQKSFSKVKDFFKGVGQTRQYTIKNSEINEFFSTKNKENINQS